MPFVVEFDGLTKNQLLGFADTAYRSGPLAPGPAVTVSVCPCDSAPIKVRLDGLTPTPPVFHPVGATVKVTDRDPAKLRFPAVA